MREFEKKMVDRYTASCGMFANVEYRIANKEHPVAECAERMSNVEYSYFVMLQFFAAS